VKIKFVFLTKKQQNIQKIVKSANKDQFSITNYA